MNQSIDNVIRCDCGRPLSIREERGEILLSDPPKVWLKCRSCGKKYLIEVTP